MKTKLCAIILLCVIGTPIFCEITEVDIIGRWDIHTPILVSVGISSYGDKNIEGNVSVMSPEEGPVMRLLFEAGGLGRSDEEGDNEIFLWNLEGNELRVTLRDGFQMNFTLVPRTQNEFFQCMEIEWPDEPEDDDSYSTVFGVMTRVTDS
jgi:hypothetical protein